MVDGRTSGVALGARPRPGTARVGRLDADNGARRRVLRLERPGLCAGRRVGTRDAAGLPCQQEPVPALARRGLHPRPPLAPTGRPLAQHGTISIIFAK